MAAEYRQMPPALRRGARLIWVILVTVLLLIILSLIGWARAPRSIGGRAQLGEGAAQVPENRCPRTCRLSVSSLSPSWAT
jgi:hypothetical protein